MFALCPAQASEARICYAILEEGKAFQKAQGFTQWTDAYPQLTHIENDIKAGTAYALKNEDGVIAGYICIDFGGEPAYETIDGAWALTEKSGVLHRMGVSGQFRGCGLGGRILAECGSVCLEKGVRYMRADTSPENARMQHVFEKAGFTRRGFVTLRGNQKIASRNIKITPEGFCCRRRRSALKECLRG